jgi:peptidoglycan hydrolase-like protein with peptidoglycan-binding domain
MTFKQSPPGFRNVSGPIIQKLQASLNRAGFEAGTEDGVWGRSTMYALNAWHAEQGTGEAGVVDDTVWTALVGAPVPDLPSRALQLTGVWEGTGYGGANGNFDGQGITWGVVGFTWANGELQGILKEIREQFPAVFSASFGPLEGQIVDMLEQPRPLQMIWARDISRNSGEKIDSAWADAFKALGAAPEVQALENAHAQHYWSAGLVFAGDFGLKSEAGLALCFDIAVQNRVTDDMIADIQKRTGDQGMSEPDKMQIIAHVVADHANPTYYNDVLKRKLTFATGQGTVHEDLFDIGCWGIG